MSTALRSLGLEESGDTSNLRRAYLRACMKNSTHGSSNSEQTKLAEAYKVLAGHQTTVSDLLSQAQSSRLSAPPSVVVNLVISLEESYTGGLFPVDITRWNDSTGSRDEETETIYVDVKPGVDNGEIIVLPKMGNYRHVGQRSDAKVIVKIKPSREFKRNGLNIHYEKTITLAQAYTVREFPLQHVDGKDYTLEVPGTPIQPGSELVLKQKGFERDGYRGDVYVKFLVTLPDVCPFDIK